jgi:hypothetical protein
MNYTHAHILYCSFSSIAYYVLSHSGISFSPLEEIQDPSGVMARGSDRPGENWPSP